MTMLPRPEPRIGDAPVLGYRDALMNYRRRPYDSHALGRHDQ